MVSIFLSGFQIPSRFPPSVLGFHSPVLSVSMLISGFQSPLVSILISGLPSPSVSIFISGIPSPSISTFVISNFNFFSSLLSLV
ncbi:hypothetical protein [Clostridioides difficile]|uniref:hypothetical protein n=1 Tax=Clostridioides difficile TaxID=1496 RepID=UPI0023500731|nr:hypothetical protein [Clostridioides difficile]